MLKHPEELPETLGSATVLQVTSSVSIQGEMMLGILWPCEVYKLHEGRDPPKELVKVYTHNNQKIHGLLREPKHGQPIGTIGLTQKCAETVSRAMTVVDSTTAPRGRAQVQERFEALRGRASVSVNVTGRGEGAHDEALGLTFKAKGSKKDDDDDGSFLNALWDTPIQGLFTDGNRKNKSSGSSSSASVASTARGQEPTGKRPNMASADAVARSNQLGLSETIVLRCKLMVQDLEKHRTVMQQTVRKIDGLLTAIKGRMSDKVMEYYAADYGHPWYQISQ